MQTEFQKEKIDTQERFDAKKKIIEYHQYVNEKLFHQVSEHLKKLDSQFEYKPNEVEMKMTEGIKQSAKKVISS